MNYIAVLVAAIVAYAIGALWYSPVLFGKIWMQLSKVKMKKNQNKGLMYFLGFLTTLITAYVLAMFLGMLNVVDITGGLTIAFWVWLGFLATTMLGGVLWENKPVKLYILNAAHSLVSLLVMGAILGVWV